MPFSNIFRRGTRSLSVFQHFHLVSVPTIRGGPGRWGTSLLTQAPPHFRVTSPRGLSHTFSGLQPRERRRSLGMWRRSNRTERKEQGQL